MLYEITIKAQIKSDLPQIELENQLVVALHNTENQYSKFDGVDSDLQVLDYESTEAIKI